MQYKYKKIVKVGAFGTIIVHRSSSEKEVIALGDIDEYTYVYAEDLTDQPPELLFEQITLTKDELYQLKNDVYIKAIEANVQAKIKNMVVDYPQFEIDTFATQENEAITYSKDITAATPFIDSLCLSRGIDKTAMMSKILANADSLKIASAPIIGKYQKIIETI